MIEMFYFATFSYDAKNLIGFSNNLILIFFFIYRAEAPTVDELKHNLAIMQMKKINAAELDAKFSDGQEKPAQITTGLGDFPTYDEYETVAGKGPSKKKS